MKYKLVEKKFFPELNRELWQIEAVEDFGKIIKGERGGWIEKEENLSQNGNAWVYENAEVYGNAWVYGDAQVYGDARVGDNALVYGDAWVDDNAWVYGDALVYGDARVGDNARVCGDARVGDNARVCGDAWVDDNADILLLGRLGDCERFITCTPDKQRKAQIVCGCFLGGIDAFEKAVREKYGDDPNSDYMLILPLLRKKEAEWIKPNEKGN